MKQKFKFFWNSLVRLRPPGPRADIRRLCVISASVLADKAIQLIKQKDVIVEVNTRGLYKKRSDSFYPSTELLMKARKADIPVLTSSDAHKADELTLFVPEALAELQRCGYDHTARFDVERGRFVW